ncbi:MAG: putative secreted protein [Gammaproteobacteria bacterium]|jgi:integrating conjugative element protein (TIGR03752 family)|nr:putative secreted protein [Gammaproteobacteria bacterium]
MSAHETNKLLRYGGIAGGFLFFLFLVAGVKSCSHHDEKASTSPNASKSSYVKNIASGDSEAESLDTLTADLNATKKQIAQVVKDNNDLRQSNSALQAQLSQQTAASVDGGGKQSDQSSKNKIAADKTLTQYPIGTGSVNPENMTHVASANIPTPGSGQPLTTITDLTVSASPKASSFEARNMDHIGNDNNRNNVNVASKEKPKPIPFYTIPANATAIHDRLMTALVGRIPVKGVVTDPYPFKIVFSDDTLAANGLRVPHLKQMIVSGFTEGDLNLKTVRGWVTSLTFVFEDGTISSVTSNDNNIGKFTKENALAYLTDQYGNPIQGTLISNAPAYLATKVGLGVASGFATAYSQSQTNNQTNAFGGNSSTVTGSPFKFMLGQGGANGANQAQSWFDDRAENSFDAIYVPTIDKDGKPVEISVNFAKEIAIDYNPTGRKISYDHDETTNHTNAELD